MKEKLKKANTFWILSDVLMIIEKCNADEQIKILSQIENHSYANLIQEYEELSKEISIMVKDKGKKSYKKLIIFQIIFLIALFIFLKISLSK